MTDFIKGMDISTLLEQEACGARYYNNGIQDDMLYVRGISDNRESFLLTANF